MKTPFDLTGRICLVTGSYRGIGLELARALAAAGGTVIINGRSAEGVAAAVSALKAQGADTRGYPFDITDPEAVRQGIGRIETEVGPLHVLVNNAGMTIRRPALEVGTDDWDAVLGLNARAAFFVSRETALRMVPRKAGKIIMIASLMSEGARPSTAVYAASKGALKMMIKALAVEWAPYNLQVNGVGPGYIETELTAPLMQDPAFDAWVRKRTPAGRWGRPEDLGGAAVFLASAASDFVNGQIIYVDGGWLAAL